MILTHNLLGDIYGTENDLMISFGGSLGLQKKVRLISFKR